MKVDARIASALLAAATARAEEPAGWSVEAAPDGSREARTRADGEVDRWLAVHCGTARVRIDAGSDGRSVGVDPRVLARFEGDTTLLELRAHADGPSGVIVDEPVFAAALEAHEGELVHVWMPGLGARGVFTFDLGGLSSALGSCGLDPLHVIVEASRERADSPGRVEVPVAWVPRECPEDIGPAPVGPDGVVARHFQPTVRSRSSLRYPDGTLAVGDVRCRARVYIDEEGRPECVETDCPPPFDAATESGLQTWTWNPPTVDGTPVRSVFLMSLKFDQ